MKPVSSADVDREVAWLREIAEGNRHAFEQLYAVYADRVFRYLIRMIGNQAAAEEATNDVMLEVWKSAKRFEGRSKPSTWIFGIARFKGLNEFRRRRPLADDIETSGVVDPGQGPDAEASVRGLRERLQGVLDVLPPNQREVVELTFFQGCSYPEIAEIVKCPVGTVKTRMFHAKKKLKVALEEIGLGQEAAS